MDTGVCEFFVASLPPRVQRPLRGPRRSMSCTIKIDTSRPSRMPFNSMESTIERVHAAMYSWMPGQPIVRRDQGTSIVKNDVTNVCLHNL